jgi:hypothetical protein
MSAKSLIIGLAISIPALSMLVCLHFMNEDSEPASETPFPKAQTRPAAATPQSPAVHRSSVSETPPQLEEAKVTPLDTTRSVPSLLVSAPLTMEDRVAKVEVEANHELRRLNAVLSLNERQQDRVFEAVAKHSRHWSSAMQLSITPETSAVSGGSGASPILAGPLLSASEPASQARKTSAQPEPEKLSTAVPPAADALSEIMAVLDPAQQNALLRDEMDRLAWWSEIVPQLLPDDAGPASGASGQEQGYEGSDVLQ